ncbi:ABC transporter substrate-binding protein [Brevibacillus marinus]|uniref:ABC transporter substrate-binding protein n=1 Tax=Brevibacillus marinus TaxID=2496837 RepID=UPI0019D2C331|nr:ABC transporter substrate-binding protein [Brevibacillus marinus]
MRKHVSRGSCWTGWLLAVVMLLATACAGATSSGEGGGTASQQEGGEANTDQGGTIKIGMTSALTGPYNEYGEGNKRGVELAIKKWNEQGGINGKQIELKILDDQLVPDKAAINMQQLLDDPEIVAIIGPAGSGPALATVPITEARGMIHINPVAQTPDVTYPHGTAQAPRKNVFSFALQNDVESDVLGTFVGQKWKKIGLIHESTAYGKTGMDLVEKVLQEKYGLKPVAREEYNQQTPDMTAQLARIKKAGAEVVVCVGLGMDLANIRKGMSRLDMNVPLVATNGALSLPYKEGAGELVVGTIGTMIAAFGHDPLSPEAEEFAKAYVDTYGKDRYWGDSDKPQLFMSLNVSNAYDGANVLFEAIKRANSTESANVIEAMESMQDFKGVNAVYSFSAQKHHAIGTDAVGLFEYVKEGEQIKLVPYQE